MCVVLHPFAIGQPHRITHLDRILTTSGATTPGSVILSQIVDHYLDHHYDRDLAVSAGPS